MGSTSEFVYKLCVYTEITWNSFWPMGIFVLLVRVLLLVADPDNDTDFPLDLLLKSLGQWVSVNTDSETRSWNVSKGFWLILMRVNLNQFLSLYGEVERTVYVDCTLIRGDKHARGTYVRESSTINVIVANLIKSHLLYRFMLRNDGRLMPIKMNSFSPIRDLLIQRLSCLPVLTSCQGMTLLQVSLIWLTLQSGFGTKFTWFLRHLCRSSIFSGRLLVNCEGLFDFKCLLVISQKVLW